MDKYHVWVEGSIFYAPNLKYQTGKRLAVNQSYYFMKILILKASCRRMTTYHFATKNGEDRVKTVCR